MKPPIGRLVGPRASSMASPLLKAGKAEPLSKAGQSALVGAKVLVSCWSWAMTNFMDSFVQGNAEPTASNLTGVRQIMKLNIGIVD